MDQGLLGFIIGFALTIIAMSVGFILGRISKD